MKWFNIKTAGLISDAICTVLLGTSILAAFVPEIAPQIGFSAYLLFMSFSTLFVILFTRKIWGSFLILTGISAISIILILVLGQLNVILDYFIYLAQWSSGGFTTPYDYPISSLLLLLPFCLTVLFASVLFLFFRKLFLFIILPPVVLTLILWLIFQESLFFWQVLFMLLYMFFISLAKMRGIQADRNLKETKSNAAIYHSVFAIILLPLIFGLAFLLAPKKDGDFQSEALVRTIDDFSVLFGFGEVSTMNQGTFNMSPSGFSQFEGRLGGDVKIDNTLVLVVKTDTPSRLSGAVFDTYDGEQWTDSKKNTSYRYTSPLFSGYRDDAFALNQPSSKIKSSSLYSEMTSVGTFKINSSLFGNTLFHTGKMRDFKDVYYMEEYDINFNLQGEIFLNNEYLSTMHYAFTTEFYDRSAVNFNDNMLLLQQAVKDNSDKEYDKITQTYLQLPDSLPDNVRNTAEEITAGYETPYEKALAIESWLANNFTYSLTPGNLPEGVDFVDHFLQTREGYCVYFASSMAVLARCEGLPSRYVIGFALYSGDFGGSEITYVATNATAHAWTEIYFKGIGWVSFDPISWNFDEVAVIDAAIANIEEVPTPTPTQVPTTDDLEPKSSTRHAFRAETLVGFLKVLLFFALAIFLCSLIRFIILMSGSKLYYKWLAYRFPDPEKRAKVCYSKIIRQLAYLGYMLIEGDTISSISDRIDNQKQVEPTRPIFETVIRMLYAQETPSEEAIMKMCEYSARLEKFMLFKQSKIRYFLRRIILFR
jgi:hypothetical protein